MYIYIGQRSEKKGVPRPCCDAAFALVRLISIFLYLSIGVSIHLVYRYMCVYVYIYIYIYMCVYIVAAAAATLYRDGRQRVSPRRGVDVLAWGMPHSICSSLATSLDPAHTTCPQSTETRTTGASSHAWCTGRLRQTDKHNKHTDRQAESERRRGTVTISQAHGHTRTGECSSRCAPPWTPRRGRRQRGPPHHCAPVLCVSA